MLLVPVGRSRYTEGMSTDPTEIQSQQQRQQARQRSLQRTHPPVQVPGYEPERLLGGGAYGEVWVALERNTGRRVAIKFYAHRGGLDWSLLSREVEKLAFLFADRYVVQLLGVGWDAEPPYYIMEFIEQGSLADRLRRGPLPARDAVEVFREVTVGLVHAHAKGVLHCDLKPANILLDQDDKPRLADFGQSRLSSDQTPALGTMFYMAPEQADLKAMPDARWDVYGLGAVLYCMLTGEPPHRDDATASELERAGDVEERLARYRQLISEAPRPAGHRRVRGVDGELAAIVDRCLAVDPEDRFPAVSAVLAALDRRARRRARRPAVFLGTLGPALLLLIVSLFAWRGFSNVMSQSDAALAEQALRSNQFAARYVARTAGNELYRRWGAVRRVAAQSELKTAVAALLNDPRSAELMTELNDPELEQTHTAEQVAALRDEFRELPPRKALQEVFEGLIPDYAKAPEDVASWFFCDPAGLSTVRVPESQTIGRNYAWRSFFHGGNADRADEDWRPAPDERLKQTTLSAVFRSQATGRWIVAISTPVTMGDQDQFLGVVALTVELGRFVDLQGRDEQFAVLVDWRDGPNKGVILQHPLFDHLLEQQGRLPEHITQYRVTADDLPDTQSRERHYTDPLAAAPEGHPYRRQWLARMAPVMLGERETGWMVIVQEAYQAAIGRTLEHVREGALQLGLLALLLIGMMMIALWFAATRLGSER